MIRLVRARVDDADPATHLVYVGRNPFVWLDKTGELAATITKDALVVVACVDKHGRFNGCLAHTTTKKLVHSNAMIDADTNITYATWETVLSNGVHVVLEVSFAPECAATLRSKSIEDIAKVVAFDSPKIMPGFTRDTGIVANQPYSAFVSSTYLAPDNILEPGEDVIKETLRFYLFCMRLAVKLVPRHKSCIEEDIDVATLAVSLAGATQVKYMRDNKLDLPSMPMIAGKYMIGDCEDIAGYTVNVICRGHQLLLCLLDDIKCNTVAGIERVRDNAVTWIRRRSDSSDSDADRLLTTLQILWEFAPMHMVVEDRKKKEMHATVALVTDPMARMLFGKHADKAIPPYFLTESSNGADVERDTNERLCRQIVGLAPLVFVDATVFQPPTSLSDGLRELVDSHKFNVFNSTGNYKYCRRARVTAIFGANAARSIGGDEGIQLSALTGALDIEWKDRGKKRQRPIYTSRDENPFELYPRVEPTYPPTRLFMSLDDEMRSRDNGTDTMQLSSSMKEGGVKIGCKYLRQPLTTEHRELPAESRKGRRAMSGVDETIV